MFVLSRENVLLAHVLFGAQASQEAISECPKLEVVPFVLL